MTAPIRSMAELVNALRARRDEIDISHETIDAIAGLQSGYASKLLAPRAPRNIGYMSLGDIMGALGIGLQVVEDSEQIQRVAGRWQKRKPQGPRYQRSLSMPLSIDNEVPAQIEITPELQAKLEKLEHMRAIGKKGGKRRLKTMGKRARQAQASHAARKRWGKGDGR